MDDRIATAMSIFIWVFCPMLFMAGLGWASNI